METQTQKRNHHYQRTKSDHWVLFFVTIYDTYDNYTKCMVYIGIELKEFQIFKLWMPKIW